MTRKVRSAERIVSSGAQAGCMRASWSLEWAIVTLGTAAVRMLDSVLPEMYGEIDETFQQDIGPISQEPV